MILHELVHGRKPSINFNLNSFLKELFYFIIYLNENVISDILFWLLLFSQRFQKKLSKHVFILLLSLRALTKTIYGIYFIMPLAASHKT